MIKLIVSDMDGTLVNDEKKIDENIYELLPKLKEMGTKFVVASGSPNGFLRSRCTLRYGSVGSFPLVPMIGSRHRT